MTVVLQWPERNYLISRLVLWLLLWLCSGADWALHWRIRTIGSKLHKAVFIVLSFNIFKDILSVAFLSLWRAESHALYYGLIFIYTVAEASFLMLLMAISTGWCITHEGFGLRIQSRRTMHVIVTPIIYFLSSILGDYLLVSENVYARKFDPHRGVTGALKRTSFFVASVINIFSLFHGWIFTFQSLREERLSLEYDIYGEAAVLAAHPELNTGLAPVTLDALGRPVSDDGTILEGRPVGAIALRNADPDDVDLPPVYMSNQNEEQYTPLVQEANQMPPAYSLSPSVTAEQNVVNDVIPTYEDAITHEVVNDSFVEYRLDNGEDENDNDLRLVDGSDHNDNDAVCINGEEVTDVMSANGQNLRMKLDLLSKFSRAVTLYFIFIIVVYVFTVWNRKTKPALVVIYDMLGLIFMGVLGFLFRLRVANPYFMIIHDENDTDSTEVEMEENGPFNVAN